MEEEKLLRARDVAHILDCSPDDVYPLINEGELKARKVGRLWKFRLEDVLACKERMNGAAYRNAEGSRSKAGKHRVYSTS